MATSTFKCKIEFLRDYVKAQTGNVVFVYKVSGNQDAMDAYADYQGSKLIEDEDGNVLWFTTRYVGDVNTLIVNTETQRAYADMSAFRKQASLAAQFGGNLGDQIANAAIGKLFGTGSQASTPTPEAKPKAITPNPAGIGGL